MQHITMPASRGRAAELGRQWATHTLILLARVYAGFTIARAGISKLPTPDWMRDQVAQIGFPAPGLFSYGASMTEFAGGVMLLCGLRTRAVALLLALTMAVASFGYHKVSPFIEMHIAQGFMWLFVMFIATGGGRLSLDELLMRTRHAHLQDPHTPAGRRITSSVLARCAAGLVAGVPLIYGTFREVALDPESMSATVNDRTITTVHIAGSFNQWNLTATPMRRQPDANAWTAELSMETEGRVSFKFVANGSWDTNLGAAPGAQPLLPGTAAQGTPNGDNIILDLPAPGRFRVEVEIESLRYRVTPVAD